MVYFSCEVNDLISTQSEGIRWLDKDLDYPLAKLYWREYGQDLSTDTWNEAHKVGYQYAAIIESGRILSLAGVWRFSDNCWEVAAVSTLDSYRRKGYAKSIVAFITSHIHNSGRLATCTTDDDNHAMIATAKSVGFRQVSPDQAWWK